MIRYPLIAAHSLSSAGAALVDYWLSGHDYRRQAAFNMAAIASGRVYLPQVTAAQLAELLDWNAPMVVVVDELTLTPTFRNDLFRRGCAAMFAVPKASERLITLPRLPLPDQRGELLLYLADGALKRVVRQIGYHSGYVARSDFGNAADLADYLIESAGLAVPPLLLDLDVEAIDIVDLFYRLRRHYPHGQPRPPILLVKDFERPGLDIHLIRSSLIPWVRRIYHPLEAVALLLEALLCAPIAAEVASSPSPRSQPEAPLRYRSLIELLFGQGGQLLYTAPAKVIAMAMEDVTVSTGSSIELLQRTLPFVALYEELFEASGSAGVTLSAVAPARD